MGKANRRKKIQGSHTASVLLPPIPFVARPFEGLTHEANLVAMREILPAAVQPVRTNSEYGAKDISLVTVLPNAYPAMVRSDGHILVALQTRSQSGDLSHDAAGALLAALKAAEEGHEGVVAFDVRTSAPRLQDILDPDFSRPLQMFTDFSFWLAPDEERSDDVKRAIEQSREEVTPTEEIPGVPGMYWCEMNRNFVRFVTDIPEASLFTALARLQAQGKATIGEKSKFVGAFRACGIAIPVFEIAEGLTAADIVEDAQQLMKNLTEAIGVTDPLTPDERRARSGLISRQVTIR